jgi:4-alpha-glucanotransferase
MLINPLHAVAPTFPQEASPYLPVTRRFRNPVYLHVEDVPGADAAAIGPLIERGRGLNARPTIDRDDVWRLKLEALRTVRGLGVARERFDAWRRSQGRALEDFCRWAAVAVVHGGDWREWDAGLRDPASAAVAAFADRNRGEVDFQAWLQWALDEQLHAATGDLTVLQDLPIGVHGGGADSWVWQDAFAHGVRVGAPPDLYSTFGQDWGSPPLIPWRLRELDYEPFIQAIRATVSGAGGLRIDHVMGLFRLWWVPEGATPAGGAYVRYPSVDLLDIVALESQRARAVVVGEDLGTVEAGVREALSEHDMLSYRVLWFEQDPARRWPAKSMAAVATHDLPTVAGLWGDTDSVDRRRHTREPAEAIASQRATLLDALTTRGGLDADLDPAEAVVQAYGLLGQAPSTLLSATLDDAVAAERRPNIPGAIDRENWRIPLPMPLERIAAEPTAQRVAAVLRSAVSRLGPG